MTPNNCLTSEHNLSFRHLLVTSMEEFLQSIGWGFAPLGDILTEALTGIAKHKEEGKRLLPTVFFTRDLKQLLADVRGQEALRIGSGPLRVETVRSMLKKCAPLGEGRNWVIFGAIEGETLTYGVFCAPFSPLEPTALEHLRQIQNGKVSHLGLVQLAENVLEIRGSAAHFRYLYLSGAAPVFSCPMDVVRDFLDVLTFDIPVERRVGMEHLYYRLLMDVMRTWHGSLVGVLRKGADIPTALCDGIFLDEPIDLLRYSEQFTETPSYADGVMLQAQINLIQGMLASDGVLLFTTDGKVVGFNVFVRHEGALELSNQPDGGARHRTFEYMKRMTGDALVATLFRSQDGYLSAEIHPTVSAELRN